MNNIPKTGFYFDEAKHAYYLDGKQMTGVTTILSVISKPQLISWASRMAIDYVREHLDDIYGVYKVDDEKFEELLKNAQNAHAQKRDKAADIGSQAHKWCEVWIKAIMSGGEPIRPQKELSLMTDNFLKWVGEAKPRFLASEKVVYSKEKFYAGTLDFVAEIDGKTYLGDIKTGSGIYQEMWLQTAGYQLALEETEPEMKIDGHIIVNITKDGKLNVETHYDYETAKQGFLACLAIYKILNNQL